MAKAIILGVLGAAALVGGSAHAQLAPYAPASDAELMEAFVTCSIVWDVATAVATRAEQDGEVPFFRERAEESRLAAAALGRAHAEAMLREVREKMLRELRLQALSDPYSFKDGPYRACAGLAGRAAEVAATAGKTGSTTVVIR